MGCGSGSSRCCRCGGGAIAITNFLPRCGLVQHMFCDPNIWRHHSSSSSESATSGVGQKRKSDPAILTSVLPSTATSAPENLQRKSENKLKGLDLLEISWIMHACAVALIAEATGGEGENGTCAC